MQDRVAEAGFYEELFQRNPENEHIVAGYEELHDLALADPPPGRVLDLGCGTGGHAIRIAERGLDVVAVDLTRTGVRSARERFRAVGKAGGFVVADAEHLPFREGAFALTWTALLLHHFPRLDRLPGELARVTTGRLVAFEPNAQNFLTWLAFNVVNRLFAGKLKQITANQRALRPGKVERLFRPFGFQRQMLHYVDRSWGDSLGGVRGRYRSLTSVLPIRFRANKFLISFAK